MLREERTLSDVRKHIASIKSAENLSQIDRFFHRLTESKVFFLGIVSEDGARWVCLCADSTLLN